MSRAQGLRGAVAIVGVGQAGLGEAHGRSEMEILAEAAGIAIADAGLTLGEIDGLTTASVNASMWGLPVAEYLGIRPRFLDSTMLGGSSFVAHMLPAALTLSQTTEIASLALLPALLQRLGLRGMMGLGLAAWLAGMTAMAVGRPPALVLGSLAMSGVYVTGFLIAGQVYVNGLAEESARASAQSVRKLALARTTSPTETRIPQPHSPRESALRSPTSPDGVPSICRRARTMLLARNVSTNR